ncbi:hypothetical protein PF011_g30489 [Phytophthora fragariae]|uniref:Uncharacterized protein n=1 Tax=Phytophthora fragariae TaxID=53985 RepID=A0A6A3GNR1_9STRA|nr:hypothetical protein PF011_g30489 [Phytophthora fragariae]
MVRVPGSSGDSGFHRESQEEVKVKIEQGDQASSDLGSTTTPLNEASPADRQSSGRNSIDEKEADPDPDLEDKPQPPPQVPSGTPVSLDSHRDSLTKQTKAGQNRYAFADSPVKLLTRDPTPLLKPSWEWEGKMPAKWTALKAPDPEDEPKDRLVPAGIKTETSNPTWNEADLESRYHPKELQDFMTHDPIMQILRPTQIGSTGDRTSSPFVSAAEADSDASSEPRRMSLGPTGAAMLQARSKVSRPKPTRANTKKTSGAANKPTTPPHLVITSDNATTSTDKMESYFQAAMSGFLREQQISTPNLAARTLSNPGTRDIFPRRHQQQSQQQQTDPRSQH